MGGSARELLAFEDASNPGTDAVDLGTWQPRATHLEGAHHGIHGGPARRSLAELGEDTRLDTPPHHERVHRARDDQPVDQGEDHQGGPGCGGLEDRGQERQGKHHEHDRQHELTDVPARVHTVADVSLDRALVASRQRRLVTGQQRGPLPAPGQPGCVPRLPGRGLAVLGHQRSLVGVLLIPPRRRRMILGTRPLGIRYG